MHIQGRRVAVLVPVWSPCCSVLGEHQVLLVPSMVQEQTTALPRGVPVRGREALKADPTEQWTTEEHSVLQGAVVWGSI